MTNEEVQLVLGGLLHDIGKIIYRQGDDKRKHSQSGYDFLKEEVKMSENSDEILASVLHHHADSIKNAQIKKDSLAYIVYMADNIASAADRRQKDAEDTGFEIAMPLQSVFNILNGNKQEFYYEPKTLDWKDKINYPVADKKKFDESFYSRVRDNLLNNLRGLEWSEEYINSLLEVLEANLSYVPSSTAKSEMADISLFDHLKLTAAVSSCIYAYLKEQKVEDYREKLFTNGSSFYDENAFILYSMDVSGIQDFIYTISSKNALKTLRTRSFYLEIMMEHIIDGLLQKLHLSRANLIYSGGGHCYLLLPNTQKVITDADEYIKKLNQWLMERFNISLYVATGYSVCNTNSLKNVPQGSYAQIFKEIGQMISKVKSNRYEADDIKKFNSMIYDDYTKECKVCKRIEKVNDNGVCPLCQAIENFSKNILYDDVFMIISEKADDALPMPRDYYLVSGSMEKARKKMQEGDNYIRTYGKNKMFTGKHIATKLWVGDYTSGKTFGEFAKEAEGIERIGIIRADVDNLGQAFVSGFENPENQNRYVTLSRTATLSRQLSLFFKLHINRILREPEYSVNGRDMMSRNATICYSGGDDLFIVGSWNDVVELAVDIRRSFEKYTQGTLSLSAGIGVYSSGYPISSIAREVADLEEESKGMNGKNAVTILPDGQYHTEVNGENKEQIINDGTYSWKIFEDEVIGEKFAAIKKFFDISHNRGKNFLYNLLELIRGSAEKINFARYVYILSRMEPDETASVEQKENYKEFSTKMYQWIKEEKDCRQLKTAITLYVYLMRDKEVNSDEY